MKPATPDLTNPYQEIREWWGEELDSKLVDRIINAPQTHLDEFEVWLTSHSQIAERQMSELLPGMLRPIVSSDAIALLHGDSIDSLPRAALPLLLYAHEVVVDYITPSLCSNDPRTRRHVANWLLDVRPLYDDGLLHFRILRSRKRHPSTTRQFNELLPEVMSLKSEPIEHFCRIAWRQWSGSGIDFATLREGIIANLLLDVTAFYNAHERVWPGKVHRLVQSNAEYEVLRWVFQRVGGGRTDSPNLDLLQLSRLAVPNYTPNARDLAVIRRTDSLFADFRKSLRQALQSIELPNEPDSGVVAQVQHKLHEELEPIVTHLTSASKKSPALESLRTGVTGLGVSAVAAVAGGLVGGNATTAIMSATATKALDGLLAYARAYKERKRALRSLDLVTTFIDSVLRG